MEELSPALGEIGQTQDTEDMEAGLGPADAITANEPTQVESQEQGIDKSKLPPAAQKELTNPDLPYAKAAAWNAFFGHLTRAPGGRSGGMHDAIAAYSNAYGRSLQKFSDDEAAYNSQRNILKQGYEDTKAQRLEDFDANDRFIKNAVKASNGDIQFLRNLRDTARKNGHPETGKLDEFIANMEEDKRQLSDNLISAAGGSTGKVKTTENGEIGGEPVTKLVTESGKVIYKNAAGKTISNPKGFKSEKQLEGIANREAKAAEGEENRALKGQIAAGQQAISGMVANLARDKFEEENKIGPLKGGGYRDPEGIVYTGSEMAKYRASAQQLNSNLPRLEGLTEQDFKDAQSPIDWTAKPNEVRTAAQRKTLEAQTKIKDAQVQQTLQNLPPGPASDKDILQASSGFPGFTNAKALGAWKDRSVKGSKTALRLMQEQFPGGVHVAKPKANEVVDASSLPGAPK